MLRQLRSGDFFGAKPKPTKIKEMIDEVAARFGEAVEVECSTTGRTYFAQARSLDDLVDELDASIRTIDNLTVTIKAAATRAASVRIQFGVTRGSWKMRWRLFPYTTRGVTFWSVSHPDSTTADKIAEKIRQHLAAMGKSSWQFRSGISKGWSLTSLFLISVGVNGLVNPELANADLTTRGLAAAMIAVGWLVLVLLYPGEEIRIRPSAILSAWSSWNPSAATVARSTVLATVLAVPALILAFISIFQG
ncbi:hypothetical protein [Streptomyces sp. NPDC003393]